MPTANKSLTASYVAERFSITEKTARLFMHIVREAMKPSGNHPIKGKVHIDEFVIGGKEEGKAQRLYGIGIDNYSSKELKKLFVKHISSKAELTTDFRRAYRPLMEDYNTP